MIPCESIYTCNSLYICDSTFHRPNVNNPKLPNCSTIKQESIPVGCVPPTLEATTGCLYRWGHGASSEQVWIGLQWWPPDVSSRGGLMYSGLISRGGGTLPCDLSHDTCNVPYPLTPHWPMNRQTPVKTLPSCNFVCGLRSADARLKGPIL